MNKKPQAVWVEEIRTTGSLNDDPLPVAHIGKAPAVDEYDILLLSAVALPRSGIFILKQIGTTSTYLVV